MSKTDPVVLINSFIPKPGKMDAFLALQTGAVKRFANLAPGWLGSRLHRGEDGQTVVMMSVFETIEDHRQWTASAEFDAHRQQVLELVESAQPGYYRVVYAAGSI